MALANRIENVLIAAATAVAAIAITIAIVKATAIRPLERQISEQKEIILKQTEVIVELARIEKYKIENHFDKIKPRDGQVILDLNNKLDALAAVPGATPPADPAPPAKEKKKGFFRKIFN